MKYGRKKTFPAGKVFCIYSCFAITQATGAFFAQVAAGVSALFSRFFSLAAFGRASPGTKRSQPVKVKSSIDPTIRKLR